ncbi:hypothetical protein [Selenomonas sp. KH1T6]|uniref:hypothetical protein n=1 Tax=Selenomonas sp. KH1T6 TaxID=3158784 RepID=UPI0008A7D0DF|nr:hypothetical protein SAMN05216583_101110 [Selenomonas ruminantium]
MANVLSVLEKAMDDDIRNQVAIFEVVTVKNIMGTEGVKVAEKAAGMVNSVGRLLGAKNRLVKDMRPRSIEEQIEDKIEECANDSRGMLDAELRKLLAERLDLEDEASDERIAKELVNHAAEYMELDEVLAPAEMTDAVLQQYKKQQEKKTGWPALAMLGMWQQMTGTSKVDGEVYCQLISMARSVYGRNFAPEDDDMPDWIIGRTADTRREIEESDVSYQAREVELKEAQTAREVAERKLLEAQRSEEAAKAELETHARYIEDIRVWLANYDNIRLSQEIELGVLEGQLVSAASEARKSARTINKLKRAIIQQRKKLTNLHAERETNLATLENAPQREMEIRQLIEQTEAESASMTKIFHEAEEVYAFAQAARDEERRRRIENIIRGMEEWGEQDYSGKVFELDEVILRQLAMTNNEHRIGVFKTMKQVLDAAAPQDLGDKVNDESLGLPIKETGSYLIYQLDAAGKITFARFTDEDSLY